MNSAADDPFWAETAAFIRAAIRPEQACVAPREFRDVLPTIFPYDWVFTIDSIKQAAGVIVHKGLMHELPLSVLQYLNGEWKKVFANEVFVVFVPAHSPLTPTSNEHFNAFRDRLQSLEKLIAQQRNNTKERTTLLVVASHDPARLNSTLRSLSLLHLPVLVIDARPAAVAGDDYLPTCREHHALFERPGTESAGLDALEVGVRKLLADGDIQWIASFDDTMHVRPDFLKVMELFRDSKASPALSGSWNEADRNGKVSFRDGFQLVSVRKQSGLHVYGHRSYWTRRFGLERRSAAPGKGSERLFIRRSRGIRIIPGFVTSQMGR